MGKLKLYNVHNFLFLIGVIFLYCYLCKRKIYVGLYVIKKQQFYFFSNSFFNR